MDALRAGAIVVLVAQHWLTPSFSYDDGVVTTGNALTTSGAWAVTWLVQVMPLVFFAGGAAAGYSMRSIPGQPGPRQQRWVADRLRRLARPVVPLVAVWVPLPHLLLALGAPADPVEAAAQTVGQLLWLLALYVLVTALTPALVRLHRSWHGAEIGAMAGAAVAVDAIRFGILDGATGVGYLNVLFVWVAVYQVGIAYTCGGLRLVHGRRALLLAATGLGTATLMVAAGPYPVGMIGMPGIPESNLHPPTAVLLAITALQLGLALALRPAVDRWASHRPVGSGLDWLRARLVTIYVWHVPALTVVAGVCVIGTGWITPEPLSAEWRTAIPMWTGVLVLVLGTSVRLFSRFERVARLGVAPSAWRVRVATVLVGLGLFALTVTGFQPELTTHPAGPVAAGLAIILGLAVLRTGVGLAPPSTNQLTGSQEHSEKEKVAL